MNTVDNSSVTASPRGGVGSNVTGIQSTVTQVNTIRRSRLTSLRTKGEVERLLRSGYEHVVDIDIKGYFDNIPHAALLTLVKERITDGKVLGLIEQFLKQGVLEEGMEIEPEKGSPQGGIASALLANIYLNPLDWVLAELGFKSVRYADDIVVLAPSAEVAQQALEQLKSWTDG